MFGVANPGILAAGVQGRTYEEFVAHINIGYATRSWSSAAAWATGDQSYIVQGGPSPGGNLYGRPWGHVFWGADNRSVTARVIRHCLPSIEAYNEISSAGSLLRIDTVNQLGTTTFASDTRNGDTSTAWSGSSSPAIGITNMLFWHNGRAWKCNPRLVEAPTPYEW